MAVQVGKYARVGSMLAKDSVRSRMDSEAGISYTEFTYQLLQGYDFVHLQRQHGCRVQVSHTLASKLLPSTSFVDQREDALPNRLERFISACRPISRSADTLGQL